jgi:uncharacterized protein YceH (UPF0502 family)
MNIRLTAIEARIIGSLIEKQITTPDQYPLSLNSLLSACNQKSNREPLMQLDEGTVKAAVDGLARRHLVLEKSGFGSRVPKYQHIFCNTEFGSLKFTPQETAIVCELLVRGPQTPGELRTRVPRMADLPDGSVIEPLLEGLASRSEGPIVQRLPREAGRRDSRWAQLFEELPAFATAPGSLSDAGPDLAPATAAPEPKSARLASEPTLTERVASLEQAVADLRAELEAMRGRT